MQRKNGFTLIELMITAAVLAIVSALVLVAMQSSARAISVNRTVSNLQNDARGLMQDISREIQVAVAPPPTGTSLPLGVQGLRLFDQGRTLRFQVPTDGSFSSFSAPITYRFETEDQPEAGEGMEFGNAMLDPGEDENGDGALNRHIVREQGGERRVMGGANTVADARFELIEDGNILRVNLVLTAAIENTPNRIARHELQSDIFLMN